jgi:NAD(P)-dependent dehydrogenase (short-subunit alcohol dehydrogenase family)
VDRVRGKIAIVTGGAKGIGRSACSLLAREGAVVALTDLLDESGRQAVDEIAKAGGRAHFWHLDVSKEAEVKAIFSEVELKFGSIDVLVNNAGIAGVNKPTHEVSEEDWDKLMAINVKGGVLLYRTCHPTYEAGRAIFVVKPAESRHRFNTVTDGKLVPMNAGRNRGLGWLRDAMPNEE